MVRLQRTTPRERVLLAVLVLGGLVYAPIGAMDWRSQQEDRYVDAVTEQAAARLAAAAAHRVQAATADQLALDDMKTWGFHAANLQVAAVQIEQELVRTAQRVRLPAYTIATDGAPEAVGPTQWLGAEIQADLMWNPAFDFLDAVAAWPEGFRVTHFAFDSGTQTTIQQLQGVPATGGKVRIGLSFPIRLDEPFDPSPQSGASQAPARPGGGV